MRRDLAFGWEKIGDVHRQQGEFDDALRCFNQSYEFYQANRREFPEKGAFARDLTVGLQKLGGIYVELENWDVAAQHFRQGLEVMAESRKRLKMFSNHAIDRSS